MAPAAAAPAAAASDRFLALKEFDESKSGVKGLVDSGITSLPPIFVHPNLTLSPSPSPSRPRRLLSIPTIDLSLPRPAVTELVRSAARTSGFFQVINHRVPLPLLDRAISAVHSFHELPSESRSKHYSREFRGGFSYASNFDLFHSAAANWRDTFQIQLGPVRADPAQVPEVCREELMSLEEHVTELGREVTGILAEGLGAERGRLEEMSCCEGRTITCNYYPWCPEPEKTAGMTAHTDPGVVTVLAQDKVGGLQVKWKEEEEWVDVMPVPGALIINVGDLLQESSNGSFGFARGSDRCTGLYSLKQTLFCDGENTLECRPSIIAGDDFTSSGIVISVMLKGNNRVTYQKPTIMLGVKEGRTLSKTSHCSFPT